MCRNYESKKEKIKALRKWAKAQPEAILDGLIYGTHEVVPKKRSMVGESVLCVWCGESFPDRGAHAAHCQEAHSCL